MTTSGRLRAFRASRDGRASPHIDALPSFRASHRIHIPLKTNSGVRFTIDGRPCPMVVGEAYEVNNQLPHSVMNAGDEDRVHFIFDYLPAGQS